MKTRKSRCQRQITLHFNDDTVHILEQFENLAKADMRTVEAEFIYHLKSLSDGIKSLSDGPAYWGGSADRSADGLDDGPSEEIQFAGVQVQELPVKE